MAEVVVVVVEIEVVAVVAVEIAELNSIDFLSGLGIVAFVETDSVF